MKNETENETDDKSSKRNVKETITCYWRGKIETEGRNWLTVMEFVTKLETSHLFWSNDSWNGKRNFLLSMKRIWNWNETGSLQKNEETETFYTSGVETRNGNETETDQRNNIKKTGTFLTGKKN